MGHIQLSRAADLVVVAPASADILAKMAAGLADDLASTLLLATDKPVLVAPAMNVRMWQHPATVGQHGDPGRARRRAWSGRTRARWPATSSAPAGSPSRRPSSPPSQPLLAPPARPLAGRHALVTSGPTHEPIDPVRYIANRSSGRQGHAIAAALAALGARVTLVSGPVAIADPPGVAVRHVETAAEMLAACEAALPADVAVCAAAVADWRVADAAARQDQEDARRRAAGAGAGAEPRHPGHPRRRRSAPPAPGRRLRRRDRRPGSATPPTSGAARTATGSSPTT